MLTMLQRMARLQPSLTSWLQERTGWDIGSEHLDLHETL